jgi:hypothetical protein
VKLGVAFVMIRAAAECNMPVKGDRVRCVTVGCWLIWRKPAAQITGNANGRALLHPAVTLHVIMCAKYLTGMNYVPK